MHQTLGGTTLALHQAVRLHLLDRLTDLHRLTGLHHLTDLHRLVLPGPNPLHLGGYDEGVRRYHQALPGKPMR